MSQFIKCVHLLSSLNVPHYEMFSPGHLKDLIRILVAPWHKMDATPVFEMTSVEIQENVLWTKNGHLDGMHLSHVLIKSVNLFCTAESKAE